MWSAHAEEEVWDSVFLTSSLSSKGVALHIAKSGRRALDSAGHNRIKKSIILCFFLSVFIAKKQSWSSSYRCKIPLLSKEGERSGRCQGMFALGLLYVVFCFSWALCCLISSWYTRNKWNSTLFPGLRPWDGTHTWISFNNFYPTVKLFSHDPLTKIWIVFWPCDYCCSLLFHW